jgi:trans-aconitate methyltransferase
MTDPLHFHELYAASDDPWQLAERAYERRKFNLTVASLPFARYASAFEPGCSTGVLTQLLAVRCDAVLASDPAAPLDQARLRVPDEHVRFERGGVPQQWPDETFDLIVLSELLYYLDESHRHEVLRRCMETLLPNGHLVLVHWRHPFEVAACTGDEAHAEVSAHSDLHVMVSHVEDDFRLEVLARGHR